MVKNKYFKSLVLFMISLNNLYLYKLETGVLLSVVGVLEFSVRQRMGCHVQYACAF